jgi:hypothetical protein
MLIIFQLLLAKQVTCISFIQQPRSYNTLISFGQFKILKRSFRVETHIFFYPPNSSINKQAYNAADRLRIAVNYNHGNRHIINLFSTRRLKYKCLSVCLSICVRAYMSACVHECVCMFFFYLFIYY